MVQESQVALYLQCLLLQGIHPCLIGRKPHFSPSLVEGGEECLLANLETSCLLCYGVYQIIFCEKIRLEFQLWILDTRSPSLTQLLCQDGKKILQCVLHHPCPPSPLACLLQDCTCGSLSCHEGDWGQVHCLCDQVCVLEIFSSNMFLVFNTIYGDFYHSSFNILWNLIIQNDPLDSGFCVICRKDYPKLGYEKSRRE